VAPLSQEEKILEIGKWIAVPKAGIKVGLQRSFVTDKRIIWSTEIDEIELSGLMQPLVYRSRNPGDRMYFEKIGHKAIKKVFQDEGITAKERDTLPVIATKDLVIWIPGVCRSDSLIPVDSTSSKLYCLITTM